MLQRRNGQRITVPFIIYAAGSKEHHLLLGSKKKKKKKTGVLRDLTFTEESDTKKLALKMKICS